MEAHNNNENQGFFARYTVFIGGIVGAGLGAWMGAGRRWLGAIAGAVVGSVAGIIVRSVTGSAPKAPTVSVSAPPAPPAPPPAEQSPPAPPSRDPMALASVQQLLDLLVTGNHITKEQQGVLLADIKSGAKGFVGDLAVEKGMVTSAVRDEVLATQAAQKAEAALLDIQRIQTEGSLPAPAWLKENWGNNGVNPAGSADVRVAGAAAASNIAQNLVMVANAHPEIAPRLAEAVLAASYMARGIAQGESAMLPVSRKAEVWQATMREALQWVKESGMSAAQDAQGKTVDMDAYISARSEEMTRAVEKVREAGQGKDTPSR